MTNALLRSGLAVAALLALAGCGEDAPDITGNLFGATGVREFTDAEVTSMALSINNAEIAAAQNTEARMTDQLARDFARMMLTSHTDSKVRMGQLAEEGVVPFDNPVSQALRQMSEEEIMVLSRLSTPELDESYAVSRVKMHSQDLTLIDCAMSPNADNNSLVTLLEQLRFDVESHLLSAQQVQRALGIPDGGEGNLVRCVDVCSQSGEAKANAASFPQSLKAAICK